MIAKAHKCYKYLILLDKEASGTTSIEKYMFSSTICNTVKFANVLYSVSSEVLTGSTMYFL